MLNTHFSMRLRKKLQLLLLGFVSVGTFSCSQSTLWDETVDPEPRTSDRRLPDSVSFQQQGLYPEGIAYDLLGKRFLVSSVTRGTIGAVSDRGEYRPFIQDTSLISSIGIQVDPGRKRVLAAVADFGVSPRSTPQTQGQFAALGIFDLVSGKRLALVDLGTLRPGRPHLANDVAVDPAGNVYITDSFSPIIYKVDVKGNASVLVENEIFAVNPGEFGLNAIAYHPEGYLLVAFSKTNKLYKISVRQPQLVQEVKLDTPIAGPDGFLLSKDGRQLVIVGNAGGRAPGTIYTFTTPDRWNSARLASRFVTPGIVFPTNATGRGGQVYVLYSYLNQLFAGVQPPASTFTIRRVPQATAYPVF